jgi:hypothetical protein
VSRAPRCPVPRGGNPIECFTPRANCFVRIGGTPHHGRAQLFPNVSRKLGATGCRGPSAFIAQPVRPPWIGPDRT